MLWLTLFISAAAGASPSLRGFHAPAAAPSSITSWDVWGIEVSHRREQFVALVKAGRLLGFDEAAGVTFEPSNPMDPAHQPGPLEDEVIAAALRGQLVASPNFQKFKWHVDCQGGEVRFEGLPDSVLQAAEAINLALSIDGVRSVAASLPLCLRRGPAATESKPAPQT